MSSQSFQVGQGIARSQKEFNRKASDRTAMDEILEEAKKGSEEDMDNLFGEIVKRVSPENQQAALSVVKAHKDTIIREKEKKIKDQKKKDDKKELNALGDDLITAMPNDPITKGLAAIFKSDLEVADIIKLSKNFSDAVKSNAATIAANKPPASSTKTVDPYIDTKETRAERESLLKQINVELKEKQSQFDEAYGNDEEQARISKEIKALERRREKIKKGDFSDDPFASEEITQKVVFDFKNREHMKIFTFLDKRFKGDKKKVTQAISEQFIVN